MSAGTPGPVEGRAAPGVPVPPGRASALAQLEANRRWHLEQAAQLEAQIILLSAPAAGNPSRETAKAT